MHWRRQSDKPKASDAENAFIWWRHHDNSLYMFYRTHCRQKVTFISAENLEDRLLQNSIDPEELAEYQVNDLEHPYAESINGETLDYVYMLCVVCVFIHGLPLWVISVKISPNFVPNGPIKHHSIIDSDNDWAPARRQAII